MSGINEDVEFGIGHWFGIGIWAFDIDAGQIVDDLVLIGRLEGDVFIGRTLNFEPWTESLQLYYNFIYKKYN